MSLAEEWTNLARPLHAELAPLIAAGRDAEAAAVLNRRDRSGYITRRHIISALASFPEVGGLVRWVIYSQTMPGGEEAPFQLYCLFSSIWLVVESDEELRTGIQELQAGLTQVPPGLIQSDFTNYLLLGEVKVSRAEELLGRDVTASEIESARKGN